MTQSEAIAHIDLGSGNWVAALAVIRPGASVTDAVTADSAETARLWIIQRAEELGVREADIRFNENPDA